MKAINVFHKGLNTSLDYSKRTSDVWDLPTINIRILNKEGQGLIVTSVESNDLDVDNGVGFQLPSGFVCLGVKEYNGIAYLVLHNESTGEGEIGTFPSPKQIKSYIYGDTVSMKSTETGFERIYKPLVNFEEIEFSRIRKPFRTTKFNFSLDNIVNVEIHQIYDGSVNLYLCDYLNYNRVINSGFDQEGKLINTQSSTSTNTLTISTGAKTLFINRDFDIVQGDYVRVVNNDSEYMWGTVTSYNPSTGFIHVDITNTYGAGTYSSWRVITEKRLSFLYSLQSFPCIVSLVPLVNSFPEESSSVIRTGGQWKSGNTFLFVRYLTENFNPTKFLTEIGPLQIFEGSIDDYDNVQGITGQSENPDKNKSDKQIEVTLTNLDTQYRYIEFAYIRYFGDTSRITLNETKLINIQYEIKSVTQSFILSGTESVSDLSQADILSFGIKELTSKGHAIVDNYYFGANWKKENTHHTYLKEYAKRIKPIFNDSKTIAKSEGYKNYINAKDYVSYFRGEFYPFATVFVFKGGLESDAYLCAGKDDYLADGTYDESGIYRFPNVTLSHLTSNANLKPIGIVLDNTDAEQFLTDNSLVSQWFNDNLIGYYFVRGDRFKNLKYQGLFMYGCRSYRAYNTNSHRVGFLRGIVDQYYESATMFHGASWTTNTPPKDALPHGCSALECEDNGINTAIYNGGLGGEDLISKMYDEDFGWSAWLGQAHKKYTENQAASDVWGANRGKDEGSPNSGGKTDVHPEIGAVANLCIYNDAAGTLDSDPGNLVMPIYKGFFPNIYDVGKKSDSRQVCRNYMSRAYYVEKKYGFFSPDHIMNIDDTLDSCNVIKVLADYSYTHNDDGREKSMITNGYETDVYPWWYLAYLTNSDIAYKNTLLTIEHSDFINVPKYRRVADAKQGFVSEYTDIGFNEGYYGGKQEGSCMWFWTKDNEREQAASNRSMSTSKYIGITTEDAYGYTWGTEDVPAGSPGINLRLGNIYAIDPDTCTGNLSTYIDTTNARYFKISKLIPIGTDTSALVLYKGDCYLQRTYIKQMSFRGCSWSQTSSDISGAQKDKRESSDTQDLINMGHGLVMEFITENTINTEMRFESEERSFYPKTNIKAFAVYSPDTTEKTESFLINTGYNQSVSTKTYVHHAVNLPFIKTTFEQRVRYSDKFVEGSYIDSFRNHKELNYRDYDSTYGPIVSIKEFLGELFTFQHESINQHFVGQRQAKIDTSAGQINLGNGGVLEQQSRKLSTTGSQHSSAVIRTTNGIYSIDVNKRVINRVTTGEQGIVAQDLTGTKYYSDRIVQLFEEIEKLTDATKTLKDTPMNGEGFSLGYDGKYKDVVFSLISEQKSTTFAFNEELDAFTCDYSFKSPFYISLNNDFYSFNPIAKNECWLHNIASSRLKFYGTDYEGMMSVIVSGYSEEQSTVNFSKSYNSLEVEASKQGIKSVRYSTLEQEGYHDNFDENDTRFWMAPEYSEGKWKFPIQSQTTPNSPFFTDAQFMGESDMRGEWMKIEISFSGTQPFFMKSIITNYEISSF